MQAVPHEGTHDTNGFASASPCTDGRHVYAHFGSRGLFCYTMAGAGPLSSPAHQVPATRCRRTLIKENRDARRSYQRSIKRVADLSRVGSGSSQCASSKTYSMDRTPRIIRRHGVYPSCIAMGGLGPLSYPAGQFFNICSPWPAICWMMRIVSSWLGFGGSARAVDDRSGLRFSVP